MVESDLHVFALAPDYSNEMMNNVIAIGAEPIQYTLSRTGMNPMRDLIDLSKLVSIRKPQFAKYRGNENLSTGPDLTR